MSRLLSHFLLRQSCLVVFRCAHFGDATPLPVNECKPRVLLRGGRATVLRGLGRYQIESTKDQNLTPPPCERPLNDWGPAAPTPAHQTNDKLIRSGLPFLLNQKDRYGVWFLTSTLEPSGSPGSPINQPT